MMLRFLLIFFTLAVSVSIGMQFFDVPFGTENYWDHHGLFFLIFLTIFPRLTLLFSSVVSGGLFWWLGFIFVPRTLVAMLATLAYWQQNPILVTIAWVIALGGESTEKVMVYRRVRRTPGVGEVIDVDYTEVNGPRIKS